MTNNNEDNEDELDLYTDTTSFNDYSSISLKKDHSTRPLWICSNGIIYLEAFSNIYKQASDFLIAIAEPICRTEYIHEYRITRYSIYAGASMGLRYDDIINGLNRLCKNLEIDPILIKTIEDTTARSNKIKLVLKDQRYYIESLNTNVLLELLQHTNIAQARITVDTDGWDIDLQTGLLVNKLDAIAKNVVWKKEEYIANLLALGMSEEEAEELTIQEAIRRSTMRLYCFEVAASKVESVRQACHDLHYPMLEEYDFRSGVQGLQIQMKASTLIRDYQEKSLAKMFGNGRARSGIIVLPCGAGKTLTAITAATTIKGNTLVFCTTEVAANQWRRQFKHFCHIADQDVVLFTRNSKQKIDNRNYCVLITTYGMIAFSGTRSKQSLEIIKDITTREWGLVLLDEVHVAPAATFRRCVTVTHSRTKLGLTATLVREDGLIEDLFFLIGPKLYEANWTELQKAGHLAKVQCLEVRCQMDKDFYEQYLRETVQKKKKLLSVLNPNKALACEYLVKSHTERGDKVLIFCDDVYALLAYSEALKNSNNGIAVPYIYGSTPNSDRLALLDAFQHTDANVLLISSVGDNSIDLPDVNVIVQVSSHFASRRQEAQRLGRILRPKARIGNEFNAFFYTLVSADTKEMYYGAKRQRFLVDQGYAFKVLERLVPVDYVSSHLTKTYYQQVLNKILAYDSEIDIPQPNRFYQSNSNTNKRKEISSADLSGADGTIYAEVNKKKPSQFQKQIDTKKQKLKEADNIMKKILN